MKIEVISSPRGRAIKAGGICPVDPKKKHWMCRIKGLDEKFGFSRDFLRRALYDGRGKAGGYAVDELREGDIVEESGGKSREYARITKVGDSALEFEYMRADEVSDRFKTSKGGPRAAT